MGVLHGCKVAREAPVISSLLFADDSMVFFRATEVETETIHDILYTYGQASCTLLLLCLAQTLL